MEKIFGLQSHFRFGAKFITGFISCRAISSASANHLAAVKVTEGNYGTGWKEDKVMMKLALATSFNEMRKMANDIKQLQSLNEQLSRTEKLASIGTLAAGVAHEINNPLASISSLIQMIQSNQQLDDAMAEKLRLIQSQIGRITQVTKDMMDFARVRPSAKSSVNLNSIVEKALRLAVFDKTFQRLEVEREFTEKIPEVFADSDQLQQVFLNLFLNARDAMPSGGKLLVKTSFSENFVTAEISDNGTGIEETVLKQIFDPFFTTKPAGAGTGLGLAVCYGIVTAHGGEIEAFSNNLDQTSFIVKLPVRKLETIIEE